MVISHFDRCVTVAYPDKAVEIGKTAWPSRGQAPSKKHDRQTWTNNKRRTRGQRGTPGGPPGFENVATRSRRKTQGSPARPKDEDTATEDKRTTRPAQPQSSGAPPRGGPEEDKAWTQSPVQGRGQSVWPALFFPRAPAKGSS